MFAEITRLAIDNAARADRPLLARLFRGAYEYGVTRGVTDLFIEVNPRHATFYERVLGFSRLGEQRVCQRVGAPAVLLHLDVALLARCIGEARARDSGDVLPARFCEGIALAP